ncbi:hypothetical protein MTR67_026794 [Solanum verrucosum]|uniref:Reverse transcriptase/retrotransposon-derived protein RNase H-like domain-containing protein n=1 Tax=Solanum verrucosum TaxID=315347 RepID=A0AAF0R8F6_SOLVR|nr:hypothetical protein MTR67_026794 [Solanum verrucosum]
MRLRNNVIKCFRLQQGIIRPSHSPFSSLVLLVRKHDETLCFSVDYRELNANIIKDKFPIPLVEELIENCMEHNFSPSLISALVIIKSAWNLRMLRRQLSEHIMDIKLPNFEEEFIFECDVSGVGIGAILQQQGHPIAFLLASRRDAKCNSASEAVTPKEKIPKDLKNLEPSSNFISFGTRSRGGCFVNISNEG